MCVFATVPHHDQRLVTHQWFCYVIVSVCFFLYIQVFCLMFSCLFTVSLGLTSSVLASYYIPGVHHHAPVSVCCLVKSLTGNSSIWVCIHISRTLCHHCIHVPVTFSGLCLSVCIHILRLSLWTFAFTFRLCLSGHSHSHLRLFSVAIHFDTFIFCLSGHYHASSSFCGPFHPSLSLLSVVIRINISHLSPRAIFIHTFIFFLSICIHCLCLSGQHTVEAGDAGRRHWSGVWAISQQTQAASNTPQHPRDNWRPVRSVLVGCECPLLISVWGWFGGRVWFVLFIFWLIFCRSLGGSTWWISLYGLPDVFPDLPFPPICLFNFSIP